MDPSSAPWRAFETVDAGTPIPPPGGPAAGPGERRAAADAVPRPVVVGVLAAIVMLAAGAIALASGGHDGSAVVVGAVDASEAPAGSGSGATGLVVDVGGAVLHPGVYHLARGARIGDAITAAGGFGPRVDAGRAATVLNLAAPLTDGQQVRVPSRDDADADAGTGTRGPTATAGPGAVSSPLVDLNSATEAQLEALPGIGPATAAKIIASRETTPFASVQELRDRKLVGQKAFDGLKNLVSVH